MDARSPLHARNRFATLRTREFVRLARLGASSLLIVTALSLSVKALGIGSFAPHPTTPSFGGGSSMNVLLGDLDGDGDRDALVSNLFEPQTVWLNDGTGKFTPHATKPSFTAGDSVNATLGDLDGDDDLDAIVADVNGAETVWLNDGSGGFTAHPTRPSFNPGLESTNDVVLGDLDGDGDLDALLVNFGEAEEVWLNDSTGQFSAHPTGPSFGAGLSSTAALGDLDADGDLDAVVANSSGAAETVWLNNGTGRFTAHPTAPSFGAGDSNSVALGDFDEDGDLDAIVANYGQAKTVWLNDSTGKFTAHPTTPSLSSDESWDVALGDLDGDTDLDAVFVSNTGESVWVNDGAGNFSAHPTTPAFGAGAISAAIGLGDLDGDGDLDAVVANSVGQAETVWVNVSPNTPPTAVGDNYETNEDQALAVAAPGVLGNDSDPDTGDTRTAVLVSGPTQAASFALSANGSFSYTPLADDNGPDSFTYKARDAAGADSATVTVTITVNSVNDPPSAGTDTYATTVNTPLTVAAPGVLGNDADVDGDLLQAIPVAGPSHGTLQLSANGAFTYTPQGGYVGSDAFTYQASDGLLAATATATIAISAPSCGVTITPATLATPYLALPYLQLLGTSPSGKYTFSVTAGTLPPGVQLASALGVSGLIGIPQTPGTYTFTITAQKQGSNCRDSRAYTVTVPKTVVPLLTCVQKITNTTYRATFGYSSSMDAPVTIQVGANNAFTPGAQNRGQVTTFAPGTSTNAFTVTFTSTRNDNDLAVWFLRGPDNQKRLVTVTKSTYGCQ